MSSQEYRPLLDATQTFLEVGTQRQRRQHLLDHRQQCTQWQHSRRVGDFPAEYSLSFLEGEFPPLVDITIQTEKQRQQLFNEPFEPVITDLVTDPPDLTVVKEWHYKNFIDEFKDIEVKVGGHAPGSSTPSTICGPINTNGTNNMKRNQLLAFMDIQKIDVLCLTYTRLSRKASKACGYMCKRILIRHPDSIP